MEGEEAGLVDQRRAAADDTVEDVQVSPARQRGPGVEGLVEAPERDHGLAAEGHVRPGAEDRPPRPGTSALPAKRLPLVPQLAKAAAKAAAQLEHDLRACVELARHDQPGDRVGVGVLGERLLEAGQPPAVDHDVVIDVGDDLSAGLAERSVASEVQAREGFLDVPDPGEGGDEFTGPAVGRGVVDHEDLEVRPGDVRLGKRADARQAARQVVGAVRGCRRRR